MPPPANSLRAPFLALCLVAPAAAQGTTAIVFERDIRPVLADRCYACHGPDAQARKAGLRLDQRETAVAAVRRDPERAVVEPGHPERSELFARITSEDPKYRMPRPSSKLPPLDAQQIELVRRWIEQGATWDEHWSFERLPLATDVPEANGALHPIDSFVRARLAAAGLSPSPEASRASMIRRVSFDLTGLPPTPEQIDAFVADDGDHTFEGFVDDLLASPRFGERMASTWLDAARYADTLGYQADRQQAVWPWRDWVVRAFNENLPYDQFALWQLAGDLLPEATRDQRLATTFNRLHRQTEEGGTVEEEFRVEYVADRVNTFGTAFLGLTLGCARCHDHKFDRVSQAEYYRLFAFFNNIDESGQTSHFTDAVPVPALLLTEPETEAELRRLEVEIEDAERQLAAVRHETQGEFDAWRQQPGTEHRAIAGLVAVLPLDEIGEGEPLANSVDPDKPARAIDRPQPVKGRVGGGLLLSGENGVQLDKVGEFTRSDPFSLGLWVRMDERVDRAVVVHKTRAALDAASRGYQVLLEDGRVTACLAHMWPQNSIKIQTRDELPRQRWTHVLMTYDGSSRADGLGLFIDGRRAAVDVVRDGLTKDIVYHRGGPPPLTIGHRFRDRGLAGGRVDELVVFARCLSDLEVEELVRPGAIAAALAAPSPSEALHGYYLANVDETWRARHVKLAELRNTQRGLAEKTREIMTMVEQDGVRPTHVLMRGSYDRPGVPVTAGTPASLPPFGERPSNRLGLARWLIDSEHPLTARVAVNRLWQTVFGRGLVATPEDFGSQGEPPSHPELLDWLARRFVDSGWDVKAMIRLLVTSATYRQSSVASPELRESDPDNVWLSRAPSYRWPAEMIRDGALAAANLLVGDIGGAPVKPYQPAGLWQEKSGGRYTQSKGNGLYRRTLYTYWKRTSPPPAMILFDMPRRHSCIARRQRTTTPLQALVLLNDPQFVECARVLAQRVMLETDGEDSRIRRVFRRLTGRSPVGPELDVLRRVYREQLEEFAGHSERVDALLAVGEHPVDAGLLRAEVVATTVLAQTVLCYDETVTKR